MAYGSINVGGSAIEVQNEGEYGWVKQLYWQFTPEFYVSGSSFCVRVKNPQFDLSGMITQYENSDGELMDIFLDFEWQATHNESGLEARVYISKSRITAKYRIVFEYGTETIVLTDGTYNKNTSSMVFPNNGLTATTFTITRDAGMKSISAYNVVVSDQSGDYPDGGVIDEGVDGDFYYSSVTARMLKHFPLDIITTATKYHEYWTLLDGGDTFDMTRTTFPHTLGVIPKLVIMARDDILEKPTDTNSFISAILFNPRHQNTCMSIVEYTTSNGTLAYEARTWNVTNEGMKIQTGGVGTYTYKGTGKLKVICIA